MTEQELKQRKDALRKAQGAIMYAIQVMQREKPNDRSELARIFAVTITDAQKACAFIHHYGDEQLNKELASIQ